MAKRYLYKWTAMDGTSHAYTFPTARYELEQTQAVTSPIGKVLGGGTVRLLGNQPVALEEAQVRIRCVFVGSESEQDDEIDGARANLYLGALGKLWSTDIGGNERWALAEITEMPQLTVAYGSPNILPMVFGFRLFTPWFDEAPISASATKTASPATLEVTNHGTIAATRVQIRIQSQSAAGFSNIKVVNGANGHVFESTRDATSADDELRLDTTVPEVTYSTDDGVNRGDDYAAYVEPPLAQKLLSFDLEPGVNELTITCSGTPNYLITVTGDAPFA